MTRWCKRLAIACAAALLGPVAPAAFGATATSTFTATITITATCQVISANTLSFGTQGLLTANIDASSTFVVYCTNGTTYNVGLDDGTTTGGTITTRLLINGATTVQYKMFSNSGRTTNWGNTVGTDTVAGTGTGANQTMTIYGRVLSQTTPAPGTYTDTVTITITY